MGSVKLINNWQGYVAFLILLYLITNFPLYKIFSSQIQRKNPKNLPRKMIFQRKRIDIKKYILNISMK